MPGKNSLNYFESFVFSFVTFVVKKLFYHKGHKEANNQHPKKMGLVILNLSG